MLLRRLTLLAIICCIHIGTSEVIQSRNTTASNSTQEIVLDCEEGGNITIPDVSQLGLPQNIQVLDNRTGIFISWQPPLENAALVQSYTIKYKNDTTWKVLNTMPIKPGNTSTYLVTDLVWGRTYYIRILANLENGCVSSEEVYFTVRFQAIIGVVVACILLVFVIIILGIYVIKMYSKLKRRRATANFNPPGRRPEQS